MFWRWFKTSPPRSRPGPRPALEALEDRCVPTILPGAPPPDFTVNTLDDTDDAMVGDGIVADANGNRSLRAAIQEAEANGALDTNKFAVGLSGTILLQTALPTITEDLDILGPGSSVITVERDANAAAFRIFHLKPPPMTTAVFSIRELTLWNGEEDTGGGIFVEKGASLWLNQCGLGYNEATTLGGGLANKEATVWSATQKVVQVL